MKEWLILGERWKLPFIFLLDNFLDDCFDGSITFFTIFLQLGMIFEDRGIKTEILLIGQ